MSTMLPADHVFPIEEEKKPEILAIFLAWDAPVRPSPILLGEVSPSHEGGVYDFWAEIEAELLEHWRVEHPGTRPCPWWWYRAPELMRRQLGGTGKPQSAGFIRYSPYAPPGISMRNSTMKAVTRDLPDYQHAWRGLSLDWAGVDQNDPPVVESEASFLRRHRLLTAAEARRLGPEAFEPVTLNVSYESRSFTGDESFRLMPP
jgi:hypothetical protein